jgi:hypothetical protein
MVIPIQGPKGPAATEKSKAKGRVGGVGGPSFASLLSAAEEAQNTEAATPQTPISGLNLPTYLPTNEEEIARDTKGQTAQLLQNLRALADAALGGNNKAALGTLQALSQATSTDESSLNATQKQVLAEARTRAAVEAEKLKN